MQVTIANLDFDTHPQDIKLPYDGGELPEKAEYMAQWQARIDLAVYRSLILSATLSGLYLKPFFDAASGLPPGADWQSTVEYLSQSTVYNPGSSLASEEQMFGGVAAWLFEQILSDREGREDFATRFKEGAAYGRGELCEYYQIDLGQECPVTISDEIDGTFSHSDAHWVVWQLLQVFWMCENMYRLVNPFPYPLTPDDKDRCSVSLVVFSSFQSHQLQLPIALHWNEMPTIGACDYAGKEMGSWGKFYSPFGDCIDIIATIAKEGRYIMENAGANSADVPPLDVKFFEFFLQHYLKLGFEPGTFPFERELDDMYLQDEGFYNSITIFAEDMVRGRLISDPTCFQYADVSNGAELLTRQDPPFVRRKKVA